MPILELVACKKRKSFFKSNWSIYKYDESINAILLGQRLSEYENGIFFSLQKETVTTMLIIIIVKK